MICTLLRYLLLGGAMSGEGCEWLILLRHLRLRQNACLLITTIQRVFRESKWEINKSQGQSKLRETNCCWWQPYWHTVTTSHTATQPLSCLTAQLNHHSNRVLNTWKDCIFISSGLTTPSVAPQIPLTGCYSISVLETVLSDPVKIKLIPTWR